MFEEKVVVLILNVKYSLFYVVLRNNFGSENQGNPNWKQMWLH